MAGTFVGHESGRVVTYDSDLIPVVVVLAWESIGVDSARELDALLQEAPVRVLLLDGNSESAIFSLKNAAVMCAVLFPPHDTLAYKVSFEAVVRECATRILQSDIFRIFVGSPILANEHANHEESDAFIALKDMVHIPNSGETVGTHELADMILVHLRVLPSLVNQDAERTAQAVVSRLLMYVNNVILLASVASFPLLEFSRNWWPNIAISEWIQFSIGLFWPYAVLGTRPFFGNLFVGHISWILVVLSPIFFLSKEIHIHWWYVATGFIFGTVLREARHINFNELRRIQDLSSSSPMSPNIRLAPAGFHNICSQINGPIFPPDANVFLSYSRASIWGQAKAHEIYEALRKRNTKVFLDKPNLIAGASWRHGLRDVLAETTLFVQIQDKETIVRPWPQAEFVFACTQQAKYGVPTILLVYNSDIDPDQLPIQASNLIAQSIELRGAGDPWLFRICPYESDFAEMLANSLVQFPGSGACSLPLKGAAVLQLAFLPVQVLLRVAAGLSVPGAFLLPVTIGVLYFADVNVGEWLRSSGFSWEVSGIICYWLGNCWQFGLVLLRKRGNTRADAGYLAAGIGAISLMICLAALQPFQGYLIESVWCAAFVNLGIVTGVAFSKYLRIGSEYSY
ncbi:MAG TPA: toll/interleukin-1 receptor domain-containing protein [Burkholderiaceae bacterium]|nr:toll/interleukin-1 receptor domain-containing protein [Burkholderiaceae bacterium]